MKFKVSKQAIFNESLSMQAKGAFAILSSNVNADNEVLNFNSVFEQCKNGRDSVRNAISELIAAGYLSRESLRNSSGEFEGTLYRIHPFARNIE